MKVIVALVAAILVVDARSYRSCSQLQTESGAVCVCNATYCDTVPPLVELQSGEYQLYSTSLARLGFRSLIGKFGESRAASQASVTVNISQTYQTIVGFGGAFTDSAGINILKLSEDAQIALLESYFAQDGIGYSIGRVPIGGADFSPRGYTYCDDEDETLDKFALQDEDLQFKIPFVRKALELRGNDNLKLFASAWTAPKWMKTNHKYNGIGKIERKYYDVWAKYYLKFFDSYKENGLEFWGVTTQNEPSNGLGEANLRDYDFVPNNGFDYDDMTVWVSEYLGPYLKNSSHRDVRIMLHDDQRFRIPDLKNALLDNEDVIKYVDGIAVHWYSDPTTPPETLNYASSDLKPLFVLASEACIAFHEVNGTNSVDLGSWQRGVQYTNSIIEDLSYNVVGWVEWNLALNGTGQPNWINFAADAPIIVSEETDEFYKQPMFYALGHFSTFVVPQSVRVDAQFSGGVDGLAFVRPDKKVAVVISNDGKSAADVAVQIGDASINLSLEAFSINTLILPL